MTIDSRPLVADTSAGELGKLPAFVGRHSDLRSLRDAWQEARTGKRRVVLLAGEPGMGKTTLVGRFATEVVAEGGRVLWGDCPPDPATPYAPVADILARAGSVVDVHKASDYAVLAHIAPSIGIRTPHVPSLPDDRRELFQAAAELIAAVASRSPTLVVVEDLHLAHRTTVRLLRYLVAVTEDVPMLLVATYSDTAVDRAHAVSLLSDLSADPTVIHRMLEEIPRDAVDGIHPNAKVVDVLWQRADGNPLFLNELLRHVGPDLPSVDPRTLPVSVDASVSRRLARMEPSTRQLLGVASIVGPEFSLDTVARTGEVPPNRLLAAVEEALQEEIIVPGVEPLDYRFAHEAIRSAIQHRVAANRDVHLHARLATELAASDDDTDEQVVQVAYHAAASAPVGGSLPAAAHARRAGDRAMAQLAFDEAAEWYGVGLGLVSGRDAAAGELRCRLLVALGDAHDRAGEKVRSRQSFLEATGVAHDLASPELVSMAEAALSRSPWPVIPDTPLVSKIPTDVKDQHPFAMPEPPPASLSALGEALARMEQVASRSQKAATESNATTATDTATDMYGPGPADPGPAHTAEAEVRPTPRQQSGSTSPKTRTTSPKTKTKPSRSPASKAKKPTAAHSPGAAAAKPRSTTRHVEEPAAEVVPPPPAASFPDDLSELWADPEPETTSEGWVGPDSQERESQERESQERESQEWESEEWGVDAWASDEDVDESRDLDESRDSEDRESEDRESEDEAVPAAPVSAGSGTDTWAGAAWDAYDSQPASRRTKSRMAALRARHGRSWGPDDLLERLKASEQLVDMAISSGDEDLAVESYSTRIRDRLEMGRLTQADDDIAELAAIANRSGDPLWRRNAASLSAMRSLLEGRFDDAHIAMLDAEALSERAGETRDTPGHRAQRYWMSLDWGSDEWLADVEATLKALPVGRAWGATVALLLARTQRYDEAAGWLSSISAHSMSSRPFDSEWMQLAVCGLQAGALARDARVAQVVGPLLHPYADQVVVLSDGYVCLGSTARFVGLAAATLGDWEAAEEHFDKAVSVNTRLSAYPALAHTQADWGWALLAQGRRADRKRATSLLTQARELADELDMRRLAADILIRPGGRQVRD